MNFANISSWTPLANHLWQCAFFAAVIWFLTLMLKRNRAAVRYWLWFAASVKFLVPFSALVELGDQFSWRTIAPAVEPSQWSFIADSAIQPFVAPVALAQVTPPHASFNLTPILLAVWLCGLAVGVAFWLKCWTQMRRTRRNAKPLPLSLPIPVLSSPSQIEPGVFGIFRSVLLLPAGIEERLTPAQLDAILAHEVAHVRRRDNLTAAIHMLVETVFWFFPLVWWLRARLIEERELACDEAVLRLGSDAEAYAAGIIEVCKSYVPSPLACVSGVTGSDLKKRIEHIVSSRTGADLAWEKRLVLLGLVIAVVTAPFVIGLMNARPIRAQSSAPPASFEAASIKPNTTGAPKPSIENEPARIMWTNVTLQYCIKAAYGVNDYQISGPAWLMSDRYDINAVAEGPVSDPQRTRMLQLLLADRFKLVVHRETRQGQVYALTPAPGGPKFHESNENSPLPIPADKPDGVLFLRGESMGRLATILSAGLRAPVSDETGLTGRYDLNFDIRPFNALDDGPSEPTDVPTAILSVLETELGLRLTPKIGPVESLVVDHADRVPSAN